MQLFIKFLNICQDRINSVLEEIVLKTFSDSNKLHDVVKYSVLSGGKRIRPALVYLIGEYLQIRDLNLLNTVAASIELMHCYSLIHDDLPSMDNDDFRRGRPSCHKAFGEANAILVGDGLQALAFQLLADPEFNKYSSNVRNDMVLCLSKAAGFLGMVGGQAQDMDYDGILPDQLSKISLSHLETLHLNKTGALIKCCIELALLAMFSEVDQVDPVVQKYLLDYGKYFALIFQIQDDILDFEQGIDQKSNKLTFVTLLGLDGAKQQLDQHYNNIELVLRLLFNHNQKDIKLLQQFVYYFQHG